MLMSKVVRLSGQPSAHVVTCSLPSSSRGQLISKQSHASGPLSPGTRDRSPSPLRVSELSHEGEQRSSGFTTRAGRDKEVKRRCKAKAQRLQDEVGALMDELDAERAARSTRRAEVAALAMARDGDAGCLCRGDITASPLRILGDSRGTNASDSTGQQRKAQGPVLSQLKEAEEGSGEVCRRAAELRDTVQDIVHRGDLTQAETARMEVLLHSLMSVEATYGALSSLVRRQQAREKEKLWLRDEETLLLKKFSQSQLDNERLTQLLQEKQTEVQRVTMQLEVEKDGARAAACASRELEGERARLQRQLRSRAADGDRMAARIAVLQKAVSRQRGEAGSLRREVAVRAREREPLKAAARSYKRRAERADADVRRLQARIRETEERLVGSSSVTESWRRRHDEEEREKAALIDRVGLLTDRIGRLRDGVRALEESAPGQRELTVLAAELASVQSDNKALKVALRETEQKENRQWEDVEALKDALRHQEDAASQLKQQVDAVRDEAEDSRVKLEALEAENHRLQQQQGLAESEEIAPQDGVAGCRETTTGTARVGTLRAEEEEQRRRLVEALGSEALEAERRATELAHTLDERTVALAQEEARNRDAEARLGSLERQLHMARERAHVQVAQASEEEARAAKGAENRVSGLKAELRRTQAQLDRLQRAAQQEERDRERAVEEATSRLEQSRDATRSLRRYVTFLRCSYERVFGGSLAASLPPPLSPV